MNESKEKKDNKNLKSILLVVLVVVIIVILLGSAFYLLIDAVVAEIVALAETTVAVAAEGVYTGLRWLGIAKESGGLQAFIINKEKAETLKSQLDSKGIDCDVCGMTEVRLRKMLLAYAVSNSLSDTVCAVEVTQDDIIENYKIKNNVNEATINEVLNSYSQQNSSNRWNINNPNYILYIDSSDIFFYFKDENKIFGDEVKWYLGAMGATRIATASGDGLQYLDPAAFDRLEDNFKDVRVGDPLNSTAYEQMLTSYTTTDEAGKIKVYNVSARQNKYYYSFDNKNITKIEEPSQNGEGVTYSIDSESTYTVSTEEINLYDQISLDSYGIPIELMMNFLNITGSGEFVETFIDYALTQVQVSATAYSLESEKVTYKQTKFEIDPNFVIEMYDILPVGDIDSGNDNFKAYYDIIFNRKYEGREFAENRVTSIPNYESIKYDDRYRVGNLADYLITAYDPNSTFNLDKIEVTQVKATTITQSKWEVATNEVGTWYGSFSYGQAATEETYKVGDNEVDENEYNEYNHTNMTEFENKSDKEEEIRYIYDKVLDQVDETEVDKSKCTVVDSNDIYDNVMSIPNGENNLAHFDNWTIRGLVAIAAADGGEKNSTAGVGQGTDYVYCKFKKVNVKKATSVTKKRGQTLFASGVAQSTSNTPDEQIKNFLELLRNKTGMIPSSIGSEGGFTGPNDEPSIVVKYSDIYGGYIEAGDLLLDNGAEMLFQVLESYDTTQNLENLFKYMAYLYTGVDYGVTDVSTIEELFNTSGYTANGTSSDFIVKASMDTSIKLTEDKLREAINNVYIGANGYENLINNLAYFMQIQEENDVNAVFAVAVTTAESSRGTDWNSINPSSNNWFSIRGSDNRWRNYDSLGACVLSFGRLMQQNYFSAGNYTVSTIAPIYVSTGYERWISTVNAEMIQMLESVGVQYVSSDAISSGETGGTQGQSGGIQTFTANGRTYKEYKQIVDSYRNIPLACYPSSSLYSAGCGIVSDTIIATGFGNNITPIDVNNLNSNSHPWILQRYTGHTWVKVQSNVANGIKSELRKGNPVVARILGASANNPFTRVGTSHFVAILAINEDESKVYISNPSKRNAGGTGWVSSSNLSCFNYYLKMQ